ncbi:MAG: outer membrane beta-barrel protein [Taibaiella sp.]|jgi:hypothetical protein
MKKVLLSALMIGAAAMSANAQANSVLVYGDLRYSTTKDAADNKTRIFNFNPGIGYQFNDYFTLGLTGSFGTARTRMNNQTEWDFNNTYSAGVFMRGTMRINRYFVMFNQLEAGYIGGANGNTGTNSTTNFNGFYASLTPAVGVIIHDGFALNFGFGGIDFKTTKLSNVVGAKATTSFDLTWGTQFNIGVSKNIMCGRMHKRHRGHHMMMNHGSKIEKEDMDDKDEKEEKED